MASLDEVLADPNAPNKMLTFLSRALERKVEGDASVYTQVVKEAEAAEMNEERMYILVEALARCTAALQVRAHVALVKAVVGLCTSGGEELLKAVESFAVNAVSANADMVEPTLAALVAKFSQHALPGAHLAGPTHDAATRPAGLRSERGDGSVASSLSSSFSAPPVDDPVPRILSAHRIILRILDVFPTGTMLLMDILTKGLRQAFPHKRKSAEELTAFAGNLLYVTGYVPQLLEDAHKLLVDRLLLLDVDIDAERLAAEVEAEARDAASAEGGAAAAFSMDLEGHASTVGPGTYAPQVDAQPPSENAVAAEKLEGMLSTSLAFLVGVFDGAVGEGQGRAPMGAHQRESFFGQLVDIFCAKVLTTFRPKYTQFVFFAVCATSDGLANRFLERLITYIVETRHADTVRQAACSYFGSLLARARYLRPKSVRTALSLLARWVQDYLRAYDAQVAAPDPATHCLFYSVVQALLYALCFRFPQLAADAKHGKGDIFKELRLKELVVANLNPLKVVKQTVAQQFCRIAVELRLLDASTLTMLQEHNRTLVVAGAAEFDSDLSFFPFDPYPFPSFRKWIEPHYTHWEADEEDSASDFGSRRSEVSSLDDQDAISVSLRSVLSISSAGHDHGTSPGWRPMSFSPPADERFMAQSPKTLLHP